MIPFKGPHSLILPMVAPDMICFWKKKNRMEGGRIANTRDISLSSNGNAPENL